METWYLQGLKEPPDTIDTYKHPDFEVFGMVQACSFEEAVMAFKRLVDMPVHYLKH